LGTKRRRCEAKPAVTVFQLEAVGLVLLNEGRNIIVAIIIGIGGRGGLGGGRGLPGTIRRLKGGCLRIGMGRSRRASGLLFGGRLDRQIGSITSDLILVVCDFAGFGVKFLNDFSCVCT